MAPCASLLCWNGQAGNERYVTNSEVSRQSIIDHPQHDEVDLAVPDRSDRPSAMTMACHKLLQYRNDPGRFSL